MSWVQVNGGPKAAAGETIAVGTSLRCELLGAYGDGVSQYPRVHQAEYDVTNARWKPLGAADGVRFFLPGGITGEPVPPCVRFEERQVYGDGTSQVTVWEEQVIGTAGSPPTWQYGTAPPGSAVV